MATLNKAQKIAHVRSLSFPFYRKKERKVIKLLKERVRHLREKRVLVFRDLKDNRTLKEQNPTWKSPAQL